MMTPKQIIPLLILPVVWGCYYVASQQVISGTSSFMAGVLIRAICLVLLVVLMFRKGQLSLLFKTKYILPRLLLIGFLGYLLDLTGFLGLSMASAASGVALLKSDILFVNILSVIIYKEKFTKIDWGCTFIMLVGVMMVMGVDIRHFSLGDKGNFYFILSALFVSINAFLIKSVQLDKRNPAEDNVVAFYNNGITLFLFLVSSLVLGLFGQVSRVATDNKLLVAVLCAGIGQFLIYQIYYYNLRRFPVWIVKVFLLLMPVVSALVSFFLFDKVLRELQYVGMAIVLLGALGILLEQKRKATH